MHTAVGVTTRPERKLEASLISILLVVGAIVAVMTVKTYRTDQQVHALLDHGVPVTYTVSTCSSSSDGLGLSCSGWFTFHGHTYTEAISGVLDAPADGARVQALVDPHDPGGYVYLRSAVDGPNAAGRNTWYVGDIVFVVLSALVVLGLSLVRHHTADRRLARAARSGVVVPLPVAPAGPGARTAAGSRGAPPAPRDELRPSRIAVVGWYALCAVPLVSIGLLLALPSIIVAIRVRTRLQIVVAAVFTAATVGFWVVLGGNLPDSSWQVDVAMGLLFVLCPAAIIHAWVRRDAVFRGRGGLHDQAVEVPPLTLVRSDQTSVG